MKKNSTIERLWRSGDLQALERLLAPRRCNDPGENTLVWSALCARARGDLHATYRFLSPRFEYSSGQAQILALLGRIGDELALPLLSLHGWQGAVNADPLDIGYRKRLSRYHMDQGNPAMAMAVLEPYRLYQCNPEEDPPPRESEEEEATGAASELAALDPDAVVVLIPVYEDFEATSVCLHRVRESVAQCEVPVHVLIINDASPNERINAALKELARDSDIEYCEVIGHAANRGFILTVNEGLGKYPDNDVILLNADTLVHGNWVDRLRAAARRDDDIATVTPMSNFGELVSFPLPMHYNPLADAEQVDLLDEVAARVNDDAPRDIPVGTGFCLYLRRDALNEVGFLDSTDYRRGYGEEVDLCLRFAAAGYRNVCAPNVYVGHRGGRSFRGEKPVRVAQNNIVLKRRYPEYAERYDAFVRQDYLSTARRRIERAWLERAEVHWHLVVAGPRGPGDKRLEGLRFSAAQKGEQLLVLYRDRRGGGRVFRIVTESVPAIAALRFRMPEDGKDLRELIRKLRIRAVYTLVEPPEEVAGVLPAAPVTRIGGSPPVPAVPGMQKESEPVRVVAVAPGDDTTGEYGIIESVATWISQRQLPIRLWLQYRTLNDSALVRLGCVEMGMCPARIPETEHLAAGGANAVWVPRVADIADADSISVLVHGW